MSSAQDIADDVLARSQLICADLNVPPEHADRRYHWLMGSIGVGSPWPQPFEWDGANWATASGLTRRVHAESELVTAGYYYLGPAEWYDIPRERELALRAAQLTSERDFWRGNYENMKRMRDALLPDDERPKPNPFANALKHSTQPIGLVR